MIDARHSAEQRLRLMQDIAARLSAGMSLSQILGEVAATLRDHFDWSYVGCASVDPDAHCLRYEAHASARPLPFPVDLTQRIGEGLIGMVAASGRPLRIDDVRGHPGYLCMFDGTRSELCIPVLHEGEAIAVLDAQSERCAAFSADDETTLALVAELLGGRMAAARELEAARRRADVIGLLADVARVMLTEDSLDAMLQRLIDELHRRFGLTLSTLCLFDGDTLVLRAFAGDTAYPLRRGQAWPRGHGITGRALRSQVRVFVPDVRADPDYIEGNPRSVAELVVPIRFRGEPLGFINLESPQAGAFSPANQVAVQALADQIAGAIRLAATTQHLQQAHARANLAAGELERANRRLARANARLAEASLRDPLTGLGNRRAFDRALREAWRLARRSRSPLALLLLDIDHYKAFNDRYGHAEGDLCLQRFGRLLRRLARGPMHAARWGGEEFALLVPGADLARAQRFAARLHAALAALKLPHLDSPTAPQLTVSIGIASEMPGAPREAGDLVRDADRALYAAKANGRNRSESAQAPSPR